MPSGQITITVAAIRSVSVRALTCNGTGLSAPVMKNVTATMQRTRRLTCTACRQTADRTTASSLVLITTYRRPYPNGVRVRMSDPNINKAAGRHRYRTGRRATGIPVRSVTVIVAACCEYTTSFVAEQPVGTHVSTLAVSFALWLVLFTE
jgi:hypothetical protein